VLHGHVAHVRARIKRLARAGSGLAYIYGISHGMPWQDTDRDDRPALAMFRHDWTSLAVTGRGKRRVIVVNSS